MCAFVAVHSPHCEEKFSMINFAVHRQIQTAPLCRRQLLACDVMPNPWPVVGRIVSFYLRWFSLLNKMLVYKIGGGVLLDEEGELGQVGKDNSEVWMVYGNSWAGIVVAKKGSIKGKGIDLSQMSMNGERFAFERW